MKGDVTVINKQASQKEVIFSAAREIALEKGINKISIRSVALKSGVSIGTVYNYYETKGDILIDVIEDFWREAFENIDFKSLDDKSFFDKLNEIYQHLDEYLRRFKENWLNQLYQLNAHEKEHGRKVEAEYYNRIYSGIVVLMDLDENISMKIRESGISKEKMAEFIFDNMLLILKKDNGDFEFFLKMLRRTIG